MSELHDSTPKRSGSSPIVPSAPFMGVTDVSQLRAHFGLALVPKPLQFPSLEHFDEAVAAAIQNAAGLHGIRPTTADWVRAAYLCFRRVLVESGSDRAFIGGDVRQQIQALERWIGALRARGVSHVGVNSYWRGLRRALQWLSASAGVVNPMLFMPSPRPGRTIPRCLTPEAAANVMRFTKHYPWRSRLVATRNLALLGCMLMAGLRRGEVLRLQNGDIDTLEATILVRRGKGRDGGKDRTAYMPQQLGVIIGDYQRERSRSGRTHAEFFTAANANRGIGAGPIRDLCAFITRETGIRVAPHALRHTYATLLRKANVADRVAMELMGHSSLQMLQHYSHVFDDEQRENARKLMIDFDG